MESILTVTAPASSYDLTTLAVVKAELDITGGESDGLLKRYISGASNDAAQYCDRPFVVETLSEAFLKADRSRILRGQVAPLQLARWPIVSITSVVEDGDTLTANQDFLLDADRGQLVRLSSSGAPRAWANAAITVVYKAGFETIPSNLEDAVVRMVTRRFRAKGRDASLRSENIPGVREVNYWIATGSEAGNVTPDVADILDNFKQPLVCA